jgi:predicted trehalose synthase
VPSNVPRPHESTCAECGRPVIWANTGHGTFAAFDADPDPSLKHGYQLAMRVEAGQVVIGEDGHPVVDARSVRAVPGVRLRSPHFSACSSSSASRAKVALKQPRKVVKQRGDPVELIKMLMRGGKPYTLAGIAHVLGESPVVAKAYLDQIDAEGTEYHIRSGKLHNGLDAYQLVPGPKPPTVERKQHAHATDG